MCDDFDMKTRHAIYWARAARNTARDWQAFYRAVLGLGGLMRQEFTTPAELQRFQQTPAYAEILLMLFELQGQGPPAPGDAEPTRVITVRLPKSMHDTLLVEAHEHYTSLNKLCVRKLLLGVNVENVPDDA